MIVVLNDNELTLNDHVSKLCEKAIKKTHDLGRTSNCMNKEKLTILMNTFILHVS